MFVYGFFLSVLYEIVYWCIVGEKCWLLEDYGYWYCLDGCDVL